MKMVVGAALLAVGALSGCQSSKPLDELSYTEMKALAADIQKRCYEQGAKAGREYDLCIHQEIAREDATRRDADVRRRRAMIAMGNSMQAMSNSMTPTRTNCNALGNSVYCTTY